MRAYVLRARVNIPMVHLYLMLLFCSYFDSKAKIDCSNFSCSSPSLPHSEPNVSRMVCRFFAVFSVSLLIPSFSSSSFISFDWCTCYVIYLVFECLPAMARPAVSRSRCPSRFLVLLLCIVTSSDHGAYILAYHNDNHHRCRLDYSLVQNMVYQQPAESSALSSNNRILCIMEFCITHR